MGRPLCLMRLDTEVRLESKIGSRRSQSEVRFTPAAAARAFVKDMRAFHTAATGFERDEIAERQLHALREYQGPRDKKLRLTDVHQMFWR